MIHDLGRHFVIEASQKYLRVPFVLCFYELEKAITQLGYRIFKNCDLPPRIPIRWWRAKPQTAKMSESVRKISLRTCVPNKCV